MESLIGAMLKIARLDTGSISFEKECIPRRNWWKNPLNSLGFCAEQEGKRPPLRTSQTILCDLEWTSEAITNIKNVALDHTGPEGRLTLPGNALKPCSASFIADNGPEFGRKTSSHLQEVFTAAVFDNAGIGLGLLLAKAIIEGQWAV